MKRSILLLAALSLFILVPEAHSASKPPMDLSTFRKLPKVKQVQVLEAYIQFIAEMEKGGKDTALLQDFLNQLISSAHAVEVSKPPTQRFPTNGTNGPTYPNGAPGAATTEASRARAEVERALLMKQMQEQLEAQMKQRGTPGIATPPAVAPTVPVAAPEPETPADEGEGNEEARAPEYNCFFAGWPSKLSGAGKCQNPKKVRELPSGCDPKLSCNPALFGDGLCVAPDNYAFANCTKSFKSEGRKLEDIVAKLSQDRSLAMSFQSLMNTAAWVCSEGMQASKPMCRNLDKRLGEITRLYNEKAKELRDAAAAEQEPEGTAAEAPTAEEPAPEAPAPEAPAEVSVSETSASRSLPAPAAAESYYTNIGNTLDCNATHYSPVMEAGIYEGIVAPIERYNYEVFGREYTPKTASWYRAERTRICGPSIFFGVRGKNFLDTGVSSQPSEETSAGGAAQ